MCELHQDQLEHYGVLGMKWGVRRYQNPDGTLTEAGKKRQASGKPSTSTEKWKAKEISKIDKLYEKSFRKLDKAANENPDDKSIIEYRSKLKSQYETDRSKIQNMTFMEVEEARESERQEAAQKRSAAVKAAGGAAMWTAKMALLGVRIGGTVALINVLGDAGRTAYDFLNSEEGQKTIQAGMNIVSKVGNGELTAINLAKDFFSVKAPGSNLDKALSQIDVSSVMPGANYVSPEAMNRTLSSVTADLEKLNKKL